MKDPTFSQSSVIVPVRAQYAKTYRDTASKWYEGGGGGVVENEEPCEIHW